MRTPRYFFAGDFAQFQGYFLSRPHVRRTFARGACLWRPGQPFQTLHYILSGAAENYVEHENGHRKIISFHGSGTVFPGYHQHDYKIERSIVTKAICSMEVLEFTKAQFRRMFEENAALSACVVEWFSMYTNLLLYETAHQEYNDSCVKLCNLLYLLFVNRAAGSEMLDVTQEDLADILGVSRVNLARNLAALRAEGLICTHRRCIEVLDAMALARHCSLETLQPLAE